MIKLLWDQLTRYRLKTKNDLTVSMFHRRKANMNLYISKSVSIRDKFETQGIAGLSTCQMQQNDEKVIEERSDDQQKKCPIIALSFKV